MFLSFPTLKRRTKDAILILNKLKKNMMEVFLEKCIF